MLALAPLMALSMMAGSANAFHDTEAWMGAEHTPAAAHGNGFWWQWYDDYEPSVQRELAFLARNLKLTTIRVWLMYEVYTANSTRLHDNMVSPANSTTHGPWSHQQLLSWVLLAGVVPQHRGEARHQGRLRLFR